MTVQTWLSGPRNCDPLRADTLRSDLDHRHCNVLHSRLGILALSLSLLGWASVATAQIPNQRPVVRQTGGWLPSSNSDASGKLPDSLGASARDTRATALETAAVQTAYFQAQGGLSDGLPAFPAAAPAAGSRLPPSNVAGQVSPPALSSSGAAPQLPPGNLQQPAYQQQPAYEQQTYQSQTSQGGQDGRGGAPAQLASGELRSIQNERLPTRQETAPRAQSQPSQLTAGSTLPSGQNPRLTAQNITTGYPFVTPPPRGRYATSAYQPAVFQTAYQTQPVPAQVNGSLVAYQATTTPPALVTPPSVATNQYLTQQQAALPQYRYPQPGIYPTNYQCTTPLPSFPSTGAVPGGAIPPTLPPNLTPGLYTPNNSGYTPLFSLGQENYNVQLGRGIIGQPTVYVPGQPVRNFMRYLSP